MPESSRSGDLLMVFSIVFFIMTSVLIAWGLVEDVEFDGGQNISEYSIGNDTSCSTPRSYVNGFGNSVRLVSTATRCDQTRGTVSQPICETIAGCAWVNSTSWWFFGDTEQKCDGLINLSYYDDTVESGSFYDVCTLEDLQDDSESCYNVGCTFLSEAATKSEYSIDAVMTIFGSLFTLRYDFGLHWIFNAILTFFAFYIPLIGVLLSLYYSLPFI